VSPDDAEVVELGVSIVVEMAALAALFAWDERRMTDAQRARAWPASTRGLVVASPLFFSLWLVGVPLHFVRTRRSLGGALLGVVALAAILALVVGADVVVAWLLGVDAG
jgi:hypothetical protein